MFTDSFNREDKTEFLKRAIDIYDLFSIIQELFQKVGLLNEGTSLSPDKFSFKMVSPTDFKEGADENIVIFDFIDRKFQVFNTSAGAIKQLKPNSIDKRDNIVTGMEENLLAYFFDNSIKLYVYSSSQEKLFQILRTVEATLLRYKEWFNKNHRVKIEYNGIVSDASGHNVYHNKMFCKAICLTAKTEAQFAQSYEKLEFVNTK